MRLSEFWARMERRFGSVYARSVASDYRLAALDGTVEEALERGELVKLVWRAVNDEFPGEPDR